VSSRTSITSLHEQRLFKSAAEVRQLRRAAAISVAAHRRAMRQCRPGMYEYQLEAELLHEFARHGARSAAYPSIVAGGANACTLHYTANDRAPARGDLVLIDAGCEYRGYAADITRTFPVGGRFTRRQRQLYEVVLAAQEAACGDRSGADWNAPHDASVEELTRGLIDLGLLRGNLRRLIARGAYRRFYPHRVGHWLGLDVHDVGDYRPGGEWRELEAGMALTVEPGLYIGPTIATCPAAWRGHRHTHRGRRADHGAAATTCSPRVCRGAAGGNRGPDAMKRVDQHVLIAGGGMVGLSLALLLDAQLPAEARITLVEGGPAAAGHGAAYHPSFDARSTALSYSTASIYRASASGRRSAGPGPIREHPRIAPRARQHAPPRREQGWEALGWVVENPCLGRSLLAAVREQPRIALRCPARVTAATATPAGMAVMLAGDSRCDAGRRDETVACDLLVIADGAESRLREQLGFFTRRKRYGRRR
jgi:methionine aminopeptidase